MDPLLLPARAAETAFAAPASAAPARVLFALTQAESKLLFQRESPVPVSLVAESHWLDPGQTAEGEWEDTLSRLRPEVLVTCWSTLPLPDRLIGGEAGIKYVCHTVGSVRYFVPRRFLETGGIVTNWGGLAAPSVAEHALFLALAALRNLGRWGEVSDGLAADGKQSSICLARTRTLFRKPVSIHGCGAVARALVRLLQPFGGSIRCYSEGVPARHVEETGASAAATLEELFRHGEIFFECEALTPRSRGSVNAALLTLLPDDAVFVNVARGQIVDETALLAEAARGRLRVALDVFDGEPQTSLSPFKKVAGATLSPHIAGPTLDVLPICGTAALQNVERYFRREPLKNRVTLEAYDRAT